MVQKFHQMSPIAEEVQKTLRERIKIQDFDNVDKVLSYNSSVPWITIISNVLIGGSHDTAIEYMLRGTANMDTIGGFDDLYDPETNRPRPVLNSFNISDSSNSRGTLKKASIGFTCWTREDLEILTKLYMSIGASCTVQWGRSTGQVNDNLIVPGKDSDWKEIKDDIFNYNKLQERVIQSGGIYDAMVGIISNFEWNLQENGSFECTVDFVTKGHSMYREALVNNVTKSEKTISDHFKAWWGNEGFKKALDEMKEKESESKARESETSSNNKDKLSSIFYIDDPKVGRLEWDWDKKYFMSLGYFIKFFLQEVYSVKFKDISIQYLNWPIVEHKKWKFMSLSPKGVLFTHPKMFDQKKSIPYKYHAIYNIMLNYDLITKAINSSETVIDMLKYLFSYINISSGDRFNIKVTITEDGELFIFDDNNSYLKEAEVQLIDDNDSTTDKLDEDTNIFNFPLYKKNSIIREVEMNCTLPEASKQIAAYLVNKNPNNRNKNTKNNMDKAFSKIIGNIQDCYAEYIKEERSSEETEENKKVIEEQLKEVEDKTITVAEALKWTYDAAIGKDFVRLINNYTNKKFEEATQKRTKPKDYTDEEVIKIYKKRIKNAEKEIDNRLQWELLGEYSKFNQQKIVRNRIQSLREQNNFSDLEADFNRLWWAVRGLYWIENKKSTTNNNNNNNNESVSKETETENMAPPLQINLSITLDGISGIYWGNLFTIDHLPNSYSLDNNVFFSVLNVEQTVSESDWLTKIEGQMRVRK